VSVQAMQLELLIRDQSNVQDNLRRAIEAPCDFDVVERLRVEATGGDAH
jgi:hypothetical protein